VRRYWHAWQNVLRNRRRSLVTIFIAAIGCAAVQLAGGFALSSYGKLIEGAISDSGAITVLTRDSFSRNEETPMQFGIRDASAMRDRLSHHEHVRWVLPRIYFSGLISNGDKSMIFSGSGVDPEEETVARGVYLKWVSGSFGKAANEAPLVVLGVDLAKNLGAHVGSSLTLLSTTTKGTMNAIDVEVSGIASTGWRDVDQRFIYVSLGTAQRLLATDRVSSFSVYLDNSELTGAVLKDISKDDQMHVYRPWWEQAYYYNSVRQLYDRLFGMLGCIISALVFFSVSNTLAMAVVERTREIGTLRALGAEPGEIIKQFVREGVLIGLSGALLGTLLAILISALLPYIGVEMPPPPGRTVGYILHVEIAPWLCFLADSSVVLLCALAAWFASHKATRKSIVEALGHV
jgi:putative ABC transport system permease protein